MFWQFINFPFTKKPKQVSARITQGLCFVILSQPIIALLYGGDIFNVVMQDERYLAKRKQRKKLIVIN